ncbi:TolC family protein [Bdellovibrio bacteriovorus]|uniref:TolC family protein n=1 Tax=Bdellovibrio bacteriovorus TaxID=959 RepID=UPI0021D352C3|nr:TolC family protein [Bdellovibrio bacteriovorus]UXR65235.1 TolC family protein [Bdellovibrio bacteriovorus]
MVKVFLAFLSTTAMQGAYAQAPKEITLNQRTVAELVLKQGLQTKEVNLKYQQFRLAPAEALSKYDWTLKAESGFEYDKSASLLTSSDLKEDKFERYKTTVSLNKPFTTGTTLGLELSRLSQKVDYDGSPTNPPPSEQTLDSAGLLLEQALLGNFFGVADRGNVNAAELTYEAQTITRANELEDVVMGAIRQFWNTYVAQENFKESVASRDRTKKLVDAVKRKTSLGYSNPGDLPQIQAEFETREQKVKTSSTDYLNNLENLITLLSLEPGTEIKFQIPAGIPAVPKLPTKKVEDLRSVRSQKLKVEAASESLSAAESESYPTLNFVGKVYTTGVDENSEGSYSDVVSGSRPKYYMGLRFEYKFGSDVQNEKIINRKLTKDLESTRLSRQLLEAEDTELQAQRKVQSTYAVVQSALKQKGYREKASQELNRSYNQGRTDISILITAMNNYFDSEVQYIRALGDYAIALNEWAASRDELIPDDAAVSDK